MPDNHWPEPTRAKFKLFMSVRHYKGGEYKIVGMPDAFVIEATRERAYAYRAVGRPVAPTIIRSQKEMEDGRFIPVFGGKFEGEWVAKALENGRDASGRLLSVKEG